LRRAWPIPDIPRRRIENGNADITRLEKRRGGERDGELRRGIAQADRAFGLAGGLGSPLPASGRSASWQGVCAATADWLSATPMRA
jgi:hypothetical protein